MNTLVLRTLSDQLFDHFRIIFAAISLLLTHLAFGQVADNGNAYVQDILSCKDYSAYCYELKNIEFPTRITLPTKFVNKVKVTKERYVDLSCQDTINLGYFLRTFSIDKFGGKKVTCSNHKTFIKRPSTESLVWPNDSVHFYYNANKLNYDGVPDFLAVYVEQDSKGFLHPRIILENDKSIGISHPPMFKKDSTLIPLFKQQICSITAEYQDSISIDHYYRYRVHRKWMVQGCNLGSLVYNQVFIITDTTPLANKNIYIYADSLSAGHHVLNSSINLYKAPWQNQSNIKKSHIIITKDSLGGEAVDSLSWNNTTTTTSLPPGEFFIKYYITIKGQIYLYYIENIVADKIPSRLLQVLNSQIDSFRLEHFKPDTLAIHFMKIKILFVKTWFDALIVNLSLTHNSNHTYLTEDIKMFGLDSILVSTINMVPRQITISCDVDEYPKDGINDLNDEGLAYDFYLRQPKAARRIPLPLLANGQENPLAPGPDIVGASFIHSHFITDYLGVIYAVKDSVSVQCGIGYILYRTWKIINIHNGKSREIQQVIAVNSKRFHSIPEINLDDTTISVTPYELDFEKYLPGCGEKFVQAKSIVVTSTKNNRRGYYYLWDSKIIKITLDTGQYIIVAEVLTDCHATITMTQKINVVPNNCTPIRLYYEANFKCESDEFLMDGIADISDPNLFDKDSIGNFIPRVINLTGELNPFCPFIFLDSANVRGLRIGTNMYQFNNRCSTTISFSDFYFNCLETFQILRNWKLKNQKDSFDFNQYYRIDFFNNEPLVNITALDSTIENQSYAVSIYDYFRSCIEARPKLIIDTLWIDKIVYYNYKFDQNTGVVTIELPKAKQKLEIQFRDMCKKRIFKQNVEVNPVAPMSLNLRKNLAVVNCKVYPNPSTDQLNMEVSTPSSDEGEVIIYNSYHQLIYIEKIKIGPGLSTITIPGLKGRGVHFYQLKLTKSAHAGKFIRL